MTRTVLVIGGGAAGFFAAITAAERLVKTGGKVILLEGGSQVLSKVRISGGGRCNVTHSCFEPAELAKRYPRGGRELLGAFHRFQPRDTLEWFAKHGVATKAESDGRMFPVSDDSATIVDCLERAARQNRVEVRLRTPVRALRREATGFVATLGEGELRADQVILATGGSAGGGGHVLASSLGHTIEPLVPSLFTFVIRAPLLEGLAGLSVEEAFVEVEGHRLRETGPLLITHNGLSGPGVLRLSAWGARELAAQGHRFSLKINWAPNYSRDKMDHLLAETALREARKQVATWNPAGLPARLWERMINLAGIPQGMTWANLAAPDRRTLATALTETRLPVTGKSTHKEEFVTCGGVRLKEVDFKTLQSRQVAGLYFAGEVLDIDGITGGYNFQAAWTTGWLAGNAAAA